MNIYILNTTSTGILATELLSDYIDIKGIISLTDGKQCNEYYDYSELCKRKGIDHIEVEQYSLKDSTDKEHLLNLDIDLLIVLGWQRLIPGWLISHCHIGVIGGHGSVNGINDGRGRSPQNWALLFGAERFSMSIFWIDEGVDSGKIIASQEFNYSDVDDIMSSYVKSGLVLADMIIQNIKNGRIQQHYGVAQNDDIAGYLPKRTPEDGMIDWNMPCKDIYNYIRALTMPYPCAYTMLSEKKIKIVEAKYIDMEFPWIDGYQAGAIISLLADGQFLVKCGIGMLQILQYEYEGEIDVLPGMILDSASFGVQMNTIIGRHKSETNGLSLSQWMIKSVNKMVNG